MVLLLDATAGIVDQDRILAQRIADEGKSCVIALNKWDLVPNKDDKTYLQVTLRIRIFIHILIHIHIYMYIYIYITLTPFTLSPV